MTRRPRRTTVKARLEASIEAIPEEDRTARIRAAMRGVCSMHVTTMEICPVCGQNQLPAEYSHGIRQCRNCPHYETEHQTAADRNESMADTRAWMVLHGKAVA